MQKKREKKNKKRFCRFWDALTFISIIQLKISIRNELHSVGQNEWHRRDVIVRALTAAKVLQLARQKHPRKNNRRQSRNTKRMNLSPEGFQKNQLMMLFRSEIGRQRRLFWGATQDEVRSRFPRTLVGKTRTRSSSSDKQVQVPSTRLGLTLSRVDEWRLLTKQMIRCLMWTSMGNWSPCKIKTAICRKPKRSWTRK